MVEFLAAVAGLLALEASVLAGVVIWREIRELRNRSGKDDGPGDGESGAEPGWQKGFDEMMSYDLGAAVRAARREMDDGR